MCKREWWQYRLFFDIPEIFIRNHSVSVRPVVWIAAVDVNPEEQKKNSREPLKRGINPDRENIQWTHMSLKSKLRIYENVYIRRHIFSNEHKIKK